MNYIEPSTVAGLFRYRHILTVLMVLFVFYLSYVTTLNSDWSIRPG